MKKILFISNGFAEDLVAITLIKELSNIKADAEIYCLPIVGNAKHFADLNVKIIGPHWELPSEGLNYGNLGLHVGDFFGGQLALVLGQLISLAIRRKQFDLIVCVGDYVNSAAAAITLQKAPIVHVWVCPAYYCPGFVKKHLEKKCKTIYLRDSEVDDLDEIAVEKKFVGNPLMDTFEINGEGFGLNGNNPTIGVLPGSRKVVYKNLPLLLEILQGIYRIRRANILFALSPKIDKKEFTQASKKLNGWSDDYMLTYNFGDVLKESDIIIGLARTANEQALAMGKPVVTFWGIGHAMERRLVKSHANKVLKGNVLYLRPKAEDITSSVLSLLDDPEKMDEMSKKGREIMGPRGGSKTIARDIKKLLEG